MHRREAESVDAVSTVLCWFSDDVESGGILHERGRERKAMNALQAPRPAQDWREEGGRGRGSNRPVARGNSVREMQGPGTWQSMRRSLAVVANRV